MHERADPDRAASADRGGAGLVCAVLLRIALDDALLIERALVADDGEGRLGDEDTVVEHTLPESHADEPPEDALERRAVEEMEEADRMQLPHALDPPERGVVDGADARRRGPERFKAALHQGVVDRGDDGAEREERRHDPVREHAGELERNQIDKDDEEETEPARKQENSHSP